MGEAIKQGLADQRAFVRFVDSTDGSPETGVTSGTAGLALWYCRIGGAKVAITPASLATSDAAHVDGGICHVSDGLCVVCLPDAAVAAGSPAVLVGGSATGMIVIPAYHPLVAYDPQDAQRLGLAALPASGTVTDGILDQSAGVETGLTLRQFFRLASAVLFGKSTGGGTIYRNIGDTKDRVSATVDGWGDRTAVTRDAT